ncbi:MAG: 1,4-alpha-glucan-branching enzyme, partial [Kiritimatiellae bacterium]|nr:1,4-alpha-glucan-branching enzyme [Kiritimatiellia bacterium]
MSRKTQDAKRKTERDRPPLLADPYLVPYREQVARRRQYVEALEQRLTQSSGTLADFALGHLYFGLHRDTGGWVFREWAPNATAVHLIGEFSAWEQRDPFALHRLNEAGVWEIRLPDNVLRHGMLYRLRIAWPGGWGDRIPSYARRVVQDPSTLIFNAQVWWPENPYKWKHPVPETRPEFLLIYEAHVGMAQEKPAIGT